MTIKTPAQDDPSPLRDEFEKLFESKIRPIEMKWVEDAFRSVDDPDSVRILDAWETYVDGELKEEEWEAYRQKQCSDLLERNEQLERDIYRLSDEVYEAANHILKSFAGDRIAIGVYYLNYANLSQRQIADTLDCSVGKVNNRIQRIEKEMGVKMKRQNKRRTFDGLGNMT